MNWHCNQWTSGCVALLIAGSATAQQKNCEFAFTTIEPFYVSSVSGVNSENFSIGTVNDSENGENIATENFWITANKKNKKWISRGTIVKIDASLDQRVSISERIAKDEGFLVPIEVIRAHNTYKRFKSASEQATHVANKDKGFIWSRSIKPAQLSQYRVEKESILFNLDPTQTAQTLPRGSTLEPVVSDRGQYKTYDCCDEQKKSCTRTYVFRVNVYNDKGIAQVRELGLDANQCELTDLRPIPRGSIQDLESMKNLLASQFDMNWNLSDFDINDWGFIRLPLTNEREGTGITGVGPGNAYVHYQGGDPQYSDTWGKPYTVCTLLKLTKAWQEQCAGKGCLPQVGDLAFATPVSKMSDGGGPLGHSTHHSGECIDIRPFRNDDQLEGSTHRSAEYSRSQTEKFLKLAVEMGASPAYFNDQAITKSVPGVTSYKGHDNHIHICFTKAAARRNGC